MRYRGPAWESRLDIPNATQVVEVAAAFPETVSGPQVTDRAIAAGLQFADQLEPRPLGRY